MAHLKLIECRSKWCKMGGGKAEIKRKTKIFVETEAKRLEKRTRCESPEALIQLQDSFYLLHGRNIFAVKREEA